jgi:hypothetical protein
MADVFDQWKININMVNLDKTLSGIIKEIYAGNEVGLGICAKSLGRGILTVKRANIKGKNNGRRRTNRVFLSHG